MQGVVQSRRFSRRLKGAQDICSKIMFPSSVEQNVRKMINDAFKMLREDMVEQRG